MHTEGILIQLFSRLSSPACSVASLLVDLLLLSAKSAVRVVAVTMEHHVVNFGNRRRCIVA